MTQVTQSNPINNQQPLTQKIGGIFQGKIWTWLIPLLVIALLTKFLLTSKTITVVGVGEMSVAPAKVELVVTRVDTGSNATDTISQGEQNSKALIDLAKSIAGSDIEVQRSFYNMSPTIINGEVNYQLINAFKLTASDPDKTSELIRELYALGATTVSGVNFLPANQDAITQNARRLAVKDARKEAWRLSLSARKLLGGVITIADDLTQAGGTVSTQGMVEGNNAKTGLAEISGGAEVDYSVTAPEKIDITKTVSVTYRIW